MKQPILQVLSASLGASIQDEGRFGWRRFGVPPSGPMDDHAAQWANRLLNNAPSAPVLELPPQSVRLAVLGDTRLAITGAGVAANLPVWHAVHLRRRALIELQPGPAGVWTYVAVEGGFGAARQLGSASTYARGQLGRTVKRGEILCRSAGFSPGLATGIGGRFLAESERRDYAHPPRLRVWPGPQWDRFKADQREVLFGQEWTVSAQSDRVGYRLEGKPIASGVSQIISEPVRVGTIQVPENGLPIVTMKDGPTVGGYPKLGMVDPSDLAWLAQCRPGQKVRFQLSPDLRGHP